MNDTGLTPTRRTTLAWIAAAAAGPFALAGLEGEAAAATATTGAGAARGVAGWPAMSLPAITAPGYGPDPDMADKKVPWPLTLTAAQRTVVRRCADMILPPSPGQKAPSALAIDAFVDEWVSAPYARQAADRAAIVPGLAIVLTVLGLNLLGDGLRDALDPKIDRQT